MRNQAVRDVLKVWLYAVSFVLLGAWASPLVYDAGKALAEVSSSKPLNRPIRWVADLSREADFPDFYVVTLVLAALVMFLPFSDWVARRRGRGLGKCVELLTPGVMGNSLSANPNGVRQAVAGFCLMAGLLLCMAVIAVFTGNLGWEKPPGEFPGLLLKILFLAVAGAILQEILFRGWMMELFLRAVRPLVAAGLASLLFAVLHFLVSPAGLDVADPESSRAGFELLEQIVSRFGEARSFITCFLPMVLLGGVLAFTRLRTGSLWLPIGLHAGWNFGILLTIGIEFSSTPDSLSLPSLLYGPTTSAGLVPLAAISLVGLILRKILRLHAAKTQT
jgi:membrane protease YdiL (CAAX protease family)